MARAAATRPASTTRTTAARRRGRGGARARTSEETPLTRRRRRRRRKGEADGDAEDDVHTVVKIREPRRDQGGDEVQGVSGSTRLEAKRQRRRDGREQRRTRPPILTEAEFLARREAVDRVMVIRTAATVPRSRSWRTGCSSSTTSPGPAPSTMVGNVYLGKVQNVLPSMEAAFVDLGRGRNAVLYAGEVNWDAAGLEGKARSIEQALKSGDSVLVQVTKDPVGHKGARLTSHIALSGRHLVYVPNGNTSGISRKLSDVERRRLRDILKKIVPEGAGVIVRTAAEGATEEDLTRDVTRLQAQWEDIQTKAAEGGAPVLLYAEPDLVIRVVRDLFNEDFKELVIQGDVASETVESYLEHVSPDLVGRVRRYAGTADVFAAYRIDEQILKGLDRKVFLPSGGHLVIDRTEAMTVVDVNTGKYTGAGRQPRGDGHPQQPGGGRGDRAPAAAARPRRHRGHRLHRHGAGEQPRAGAAPPDRVPGPRPHQASGHRDHLAGSGPDDAQAHRRRPAGGVQRALRALQRARRDDPHGPGAGAQGAAAGPASRRSRRPRRPRPPRAQAYDVDTEGYDLSRYANDEDDTTSRSPTTRSEQGEAPVRRRTRRGGRRRTGCR